jgi:hypothetical protein
LKWKILHLFFLPIFVFLRYFKHFSGSNIILEHGAMKPRFCVLTHFKKVYSLLWSRTPSAGRSADTIQCQLNEYKTRSSTKIFSGKKRNFWDYCGCLKFKKMTKASHG